MQSFNLLKQEFLKNWREGLQECNSSSKNNGIFERKNAIKLSADIAMASTRRGRTSWSRAVIAKASSQTQQSNHNVLRVKMTNKVASKHRQFRSKKITKRSQNFHRAMLIRKKRNHVNIPNSTAKRLIGKRTQVLKRLLPGGEQCLDEVSLIREALDYVISLQAQVDVMRSCLAAATIELANDK